MAGIGNAGKNTKAGQILSALRKQKSGLTTNQISNRVKVTPSRARFLISELRTEGFPVYSNRDTNGTVRYRLAPASRLMVAIAAKVAGAGLFTNNDTK